MTELDSKKSDDCGCCHDHEPEAAHHHEPSRARSMAAMALWAFLALCLGTIIIKTAMGHRPHAHGEDPTETISHDNHDHDHDHDHEETRP
jgi:hypothetical protein